VEEAGCGQFCQSGLRRVVTASATRACPRMSRDCVCCLGLASNESLLCLPLEGVLRRVMTASPVGLGLGRFLTASPARE
jgi:hypothetical protein